MTFQAYLVWRGVSLTPLESQRRRLPDAACGAPLHRSNAEITPRPVIDSHHEVQRDGADD